MSRQISSLAKRITTECHNPCDPILLNPLSIKLDLCNLQETVYDRLNLLQLPPEILMMILQTLPPSSVLSFFCSSKKALSLANTFCDKRQLHFCGLVGTMELVGTKDTTDYRQMLLSIPKSQDPELDQRWELLSKVTQLATYVVKIDRKCLLGPTLDMKAPLKFVHHPFGFKNLVADISDDVKSIEVYMRALYENHYVCGIRLDASTTHPIIVGNESKVSYKVDVSQFRIDTIRFTVDSLGLRALQFGGSQWSPRDPAQIGCWEGFSRRRDTTKIQIVQDVSIQTCVY